MINIVAIDNALVELAKQGYERINARQVAYLTQQSDDTNTLQAIHAYLTSREPYVLEPMYEIVCPHCDITAAYAGLYALPTNEPVVCMTCDKRFELNISKVRLVHAFKEDYVIAVKGEVVKADKLEI